MYSVPKRRRCLEAEMINFLQEYKLMIISYTVLRKDMQSRSIEATENVFPL